MISSEAFFSCSMAHGYRFFCGVPCSYLTPLINGAISDERLQYVGASSEGEAVALASGATLAGAPSVVMCQNSGLGNAVNPLTSLAAPFRIPFLLVTTWRGENQQNVEPQHRLMGRMTGDLLRLMAIPHALFPQSESAIAEVLEQADAHYRRHSTPWALIMQKGAVRDDGLNERPLPKPDGRGIYVDKRQHPKTPVSRADSLRCIRSIVAESIPLIATTGKCCRELFELGDHSGHFYQIGAMGCASGFALGVALCCPRHVVVLDGDGAALMKLGSFATIGAYQPQRYTHVLLDNGCHDSTGGQRTVSAHVDFCDIALACGYRAAYCCDSLVGLREAWQARQSIKGPVMIYMSIAAGSMSPLGRPSVPAPRLAQRFKAFLQEPCDLP
ncbi:MAG: phosphonopyruvate decarboxylase [Alphaproteobacteria bacterium GM202ARS2]|nr:phosphonopyruvate decarboxylase [Alphaproteobacteria bacterium GM202ARS2]